MAKVRVSCSMSVDVLEDVKVFAGEFGRDTKMRINVSEAIQMLVSEALEARMKKSTEALDQFAVKPAQSKGVVPVYQRPAFNPVPKPK